MVLNVHVNEAVEMIKAKVNKPISLRIVNPKTINVGYEVSVKLPLIGNKSKNITIDFIIDKVVDTDIYFHYSAGIIGGDSVINVLMSFLPVVSESKFVDRHEDGLITFHLREVKQLEDILEKVKINSISFEQDSILIDFTPKI